MIPAFALWLLTQTEYTPDDYPVSLSITALMHRFGGFERRCPRVSTARADCGGRLGINVRHMFLVFLALCEQAMAHGLKLANRTRATLVGSLACDDRH